MRSLKDTEGLCSDNVHNAVLHCTLSTSGCYCSTEIQEYQHS